MSTSVLRVPSAAARLMNDYLLGVKEITADCGGQL